MTVVTITGWSGIDEEKKKKWIENCTDVIHELLSDPLDEITVYIEEIYKGNWGQAGVVGTDQDWLTKSKYKTKGGE